MKKSIKIMSALALLLCLSYSNVSELKAENNAQLNSCTYETGSGKILSLCPGLKAGLMKDEITGDVYEFHYAGPEVLEVNAEYVYIVLTTGSGKIIIRDIHRK